jgi:hypothetical protein
VCNWLMGLFCFSLMVTKFLYLNHKLPQGMISHSDKLCAQYFHLFFSSMWLRLELRALHLQSRSPSTSATPPVCFPLVIFGDEVPHLDSNQDPPDFSLPSS